jgi:hypothetical protein
MTWKFLSATAALVLSLAPAAVAQQQLIPDDVAAAMRDWSACQMNFIQGKLSSETPAETLADQSLENCKYQEAKVSSTIHEHYGHSEDGVVSRQRERNKERAISFINDVRAGRPISDPTIAWGECIGERAGKEARTSKTDDEIVDQAIQACSSFEMPVLDNLLKTNSTTDANALLDQVRHTLRNQFMIMLLNSRNNLPDGH